MKKLLTFCLVGILLVAFGGCNSTPQATAENKSAIYYLNIEASKLIAEDYTLKSSDTKGQIEELYSSITTEVASDERIPLLPAEVKMQSWRLDGGNLWIDFNANYAQLETTREVLIRAGIVHTFTDVEEVKKVGIMVEGKELIDVKGELVGLMGIEDFVEDSGKEVNAYQYVTMKLYFANKAGDKLLLEERKVYYNKNIPIERAVVEQLLEGPQNEGSYPTIPIDTKILSVSTMEELGYVNLDQAMLNSALPVRGEIAVQSIVRTIVEACDVDQVQISINGETKVDLRDNISLDQFFEVDNSLLEVTD